MRAPTSATRKPCCLTSGAVWRLLTTTATDGPSAVRSSSSRWTAPGWRWLCAGKTPPSPRTRRATRRRTPFPSTDPRACFWPTGSSRRERYRCSPLEPIRPTPVPKARALAVRSPNVRFILSAKRDTHMESDLIACQQAGEPYCRNHSGFSADASVHILAGWKAERLRASEFGRILL
jgi:hypothetical protein